MDFQFIMPIASAIMIFLNADVFKHFQRLMNAITKGIEKREQNQFTIDAFFNIIIVELNENGVRR